MGKLLFLILFIAVLVLTQNAYAWKVPSGAVNTINISLKNNFASGALTGNVPVFISINTLNFTTTQCSGASCINGGGNNIELFNGVTGNVLYQFWVGNTANELQTTSLNTVVSLGVYFTREASIASSTNGVNVISLAFLPLTSTAMTGNNVNQAGQLSTTVNAFAGGAANVFTTFQEFSGISALPSGWSKILTTGVTFNTKNTVISSPDNVNWYGITSSAPSGVNTLNTIETLASFNGGQTGFGLMAGTGGVYGGSSVALLMLDKPQAGACPNTLDFFMVEGTSSTKQCTTWVGPSNSPNDTKILFGNAATSNSNLLGNVLGFNTIMGQSTSAESGNPSKINYMLGQNTGEPLGSEAIYWYAQYSSPPNNAMPTTVFGPVQNVAGAYSAPSTPYCTTASNAITDVGQTESITCTVSGGTTPYTFNQFVYNTLNNNANQLAFNSIQSTTATSVTFSFTTNALMVTNSPLKFNAIVIDAHPTTVNSVTDNAFSVNTALAGGTITPASPTIDNGQSLTLTANPSGGTLPYSYQWYTATGAGVACISQTLISGATSSTYSASPTSTNSYCVKTTDSPSVATSANSASYTLTVNTAPTMTISPSNILLDSGQWESYTLTTASGIAPFNSQLYNVTGAVHQGANVLITTIGGSSTVNFLVTSVTNSNNFQFNGIGTDTGSSAGNFVFNSVTNTITVNTVLVAPTVTPATKTVITGTAITMSGSWSGGTSPYTVNWVVINTVTAFNSLTSNNYLANTFTFTPTVSGTYYANLIITDGATTAVTLNSVNSVITVVNTLSVPTLTISNTPLQEGQPELLSANVLGGISPYTYNYQIINSITNTVIANQLYTGVTTTSNSFTWIPNIWIAGNTLLANVIITDTNPTTTNSVYSAINTTTFPTYVGTSVSTTQVTTTITQIQSTPTALDKIVLASFTILGYPITITFLWIVVGLVIIVVLAIGAFLLHYFGYLEEEED